MAITNPLVIGLGGIGSLVASLLVKLGMQVTGMDRENGHHVPQTIDLIIGDVTHPDTLAGALQGKDAVIACLPYPLILTVAQLAHRAGLHYFDPTEDIKTTQAIRLLACDAKGVMIPQNGLAPGFIGILGAHLAYQFDVGTLRHIKMRVGALPQHPIGQLGYAGNWSMQGLVHEYIAECDSIANGKRQTERALKNPEILRIHGVEYEAFTTSGGLGTMTETFEGKVETMDYKSIRYPGHLEGMKLLIEELRFRDDPEQLVKCLTNALPPDDQDRVLIHVSVQGRIGGKLQTRELVTDYKPIHIDGRPYTAIAWTTAAAITAVIELVSNMTLPQQGFVKQEEIPLHAFLQASTGKLYAEHHPTLAALTGV
ncbi:MAG: saccharopine dehydrogenase NADP-binding domain-containing protein [bacterium]|nr:saccharopine dehydrogenase NADP-binding domain-containing protein [bacterium]